MGTLEAQFKNQLRFCFCFFEIIGSLQKSYKKRTKSSHTSFIQIHHLLKSVTFYSVVSPHTHIPITTSWIIWEQLAYTYSYIHLLLPVEQSADTMRPCVYPKDVVVTYIIAVQLSTSGNLTSIRYYNLMYRHYSNFTNGPNDVWYTVPPPPPPC